MYLLIVGALLTIISYVYKDRLDEVRVFMLNQLVCFTLLLTVLAGIFLFMMVVEHRIKTVYYVHNLNSIRNWFINQSTKNIDKFLLLSSDKKYPPYFIKKKDFFWELSVFAIINSSLISVGLMNILSRFFQDWFASDLIIHPIIFLILIATTYYIHIIAYKNRGKKQEV
jgi:hypothetical protein